MNLSQMSRSVDAIWARLTSAGLTHVCSQFVCNLESGWVLMALLNKSRNLGDLDLEIPQCNFCHIVLVKKDSRPTRHKGWKPYYKEMIIKSTFINDLPHALVSSTRMGTEFTHLSIPRTHQELGLCECFMMDADEWKILKKTPQGRRNLEIEQAMYWMSLWKTLS